MRLINAETGRVIQLFTADEVRPRLGFDLPKLVHHVVSKYGFSSGPTDTAGLSLSTGLRFEKGRFSAANVGEAAIEDLSLHNDGIIASCADTDIADRFIDDVVEWLIESALIRQPVTEKPRIYTSNLVVEFDLLPKVLLDRIFRLSDKLREALNDQYGWDHPTSLHRLAFSSDPSAIPAHRNTLFAIERRANIPFHQNWFWSAAPLPILKHIRLLEAVEREFIDN